MLVAQATDQADDVRELEVELTKTADRVRRLPVRSIGDEAEALRKIGQELLTEFLVRIINPTNPAEPRIAERRQAQLLREDVDLAAPEDIGLMAR